MKTTVLFFDANKKLLGKLSQNKNQLSAELNENQNEIKEELQKFLKKLINNKLYKKEQRKANGMIYEDKIEVENQSERMIAYAEAITRNKFSFGRIYAVAIDNSGTGE